MFFDSSVRSTRTIVLRSRAADLLAQRRQPLVHVRPVRPLPQELRVRAEAVHAEPGRTALVRDGDLAVRAARHLGAQHRRAAVRERLGPAPGQERRPVAAQHPAQHRLGHIVRQHAEVVGGRPRRVREVPDAQVGAAGAEQAGHQREVVVLHQDHGAGCGLVGERVREGRVVRLVRRPPRAERVVEGRLQRRLVEHVVDEPEHRVRDAVVGVGEDIGGDVQHAYVLAARVGGVQVAAAAPGRLAVAVPEGGAHPHRTGVGPDGGETGDQPAAAAFGGERAVISLRVRHRAAVGRDENLGTRTLGDHAARLARRRSAQTCGAQGERHGFRRVRRVLDPPQAARRSAYSGISAIGGRSSVSTSQVRGTKPASPRSNWVSRGRTRWPRASRSCAVR
ncbi:hypothetical protein SRIMM317S_05411 [Streptomyces rimosus subsp. rimosus]